MDHVEPSLGILPRLCARCTVDSTFLAKFVANLEDTPNRFSQFCLDDALDDRMTDVIACMSRINTELGSPCSAIQRT
jgi:hypothetical protein